MSAHRTTDCARHGHPELALTVGEAPPVAGLYDSIVGNLLRYLEGEVARGVKFRAGETVQLGWSTLRLCARNDGALGLEERLLSPQPSWREEVSRALGDFWLQTQVAQSVALEDHLKFPRQDDALLMDLCARAGEELTLIRLAEADCPAGFSGWTLGCRAEHAHQDKEVVPLLALAANLPGLVQFLALPHGTAALVQWREHPDAPGHKRISARLFRDDAELTPAPGSYLDALRR